MNNGCSEAEIGKRVQKEVTNTVQLGRTRPPAPVGRLVPPAGKIKRRGSQNSQRLTAPKGPRPQLHFPPEAPGGWFPGQRAVGGPGEFRPTPAPED